MKTQRRQFATLPDWPVTLRQHSIVLIPTLVGSAFIVGAMLALNRHWPLPIPVLIGAVFAAGKVGYHLVAWRVFAVMVSRHRITVRRLSRGAVLRTVYEYPGVRGVSFKRAPLDVVFDTVTLLVYLPDRTLRLALLTPFSLLRSLDAADDARPQPAASGDTLRLPVAANPGAVLRGRFAVGKVLAKTAHNTLYLGVDQRDSQKIVIKRFALAPHADHYGAALNAFRHEARLLGRLRHPQFPRLRAAIHNGTGWYIVMEYIDGITLDRLLKLESPPLDLALAIADELCEALAYLHRLQPPIIHADIKPSNIMLARDGRVVVLDFGLSRPDGSAAAVAMGTPPYTPPEQWRGEILDERADIYALGIVLRDLFGGEDRPLPPWIRRVVARAIAHDPGERYASVDMLRRDLWRQ